MKLTPAAFILFFLLRGDRRAAATSALSFGRSPRPGLLVLAVLDRRRSWQAGLAAFCGGFVVFMVSPPWLLPHYGDAELQWAPWEQVAGDSYAIIAVTMLALSVRLPLLSRPTAHVQVEVQRSGSGGPRVELGMSPERSLGSTRLIPQVHLGADARRADARRRVRSGGALASKATPRTRRSGHHRRAG